MGRFLLVIGILVFLLSLFVLVVSLATSSEYTIIAIFGMLNASIAIGVSEILYKLNHPQKKEIK